MASFAIKAFGTAMIFRVPDDADMTGFRYMGCRNRADAQRQINAYLESCGYDLSQSHLWS